MATAGRRRERGRAARVSETDVVVGESDVQEIEKYSREIEKYSRYTERVVARGHGENRKLVDDSPIAEFCLSLARSSERKPIVLT